MGTKIPAELIKREKTFEFRFPVAICPFCQEQTPFGVMSQMVGSLPRYNYYCLGCARIVPGENLGILGYVSLYELEEYKWEDNL